MIERQELEKEKQKQKDFKTFAEAYERVLWGK
jgi:hypothetical protein